MKLEKWAIQAVAWAFLMQMLAMSCAKEYSYEGGIVPDSVRVVNDTFSTINRWNIPKCYACNPQFGADTNTWSLWVNNSQACGSFTRTVINRERDAFTFFGPSACSIDSGVILNSFWSPVVFDRDLQNISTQRTAFYYYDNTTNQYVLEAKREKPFTIIIENYHHQSGIATGYCTGYAINRQSDTIGIQLLRFKIKIPG